MSPPNGTEASTGTQAVDRAAQLVSTVVHADEPLTFADLQEASGLAKSTTSRMLTALERTGLVERDAAGSYVAGRLFWLYAARHDPWEELVRLARPAMERIGDDTHETVHLSVTRGETVVQVAQVDSRYLLGTRDWTEIEVPAAHARRWARSSTPGARWRCRRTARAAHRATVVTPEELRRDGIRTRKRGWAVTSRRARGRARPASPYPSRARAATSSPPSASRDPPPGWRAGSTSSAASSRTTRRSSRRCCAAAPTTAMNKKEGVA